MFKVKGHYIYLTRDQEMDIRGKVFKDKTPEYRGASVIKDTEANKEFNRLTREWLENNLNDSLIYFDFNGQDAKDNITDLLLDYCLINKNVWVLDNCDPVERLVAGYDGDFEHPLGRSFSVKITSKNIWRKTCTEVVVRINSDDIVSVQGRLDDFTVKLRNFTLTLNDTITIK